jgi:vacuolar-type H+-ATPase subunit E/Vma4
MDEGRNSDGLFTAIGQQAERERNAVLAEAEARARDILARADAKAGRMRAEALKRLERELAVERERLLGEARMEIRNERLAVKRRLLAEAFGRARAELTPAAVRGGVLKALAAEALAAAGEGGTVQTDDTHASVLARSRDGRTRVDNSPLMRLARAEAVEEVEVARLLFGAQESAPPDGGREPGGHG